MTDKALTTTPEGGTFDLALLKAVGLDRAAPEQRALAINIAERYGLDLLLKHLVLIEGRPYVTRDALLHIAHRSGQFDGIEVTEPLVIDGYWRCSATVYRKDMSHPITYPGRYPTSGGNAKFAPEMAIKVAESMALRRAFNVAAPVVEERWDVETPTEPPAPRPSLAERAAAKAAEVPAFTATMQTAAEPLELVTMTAEASEKYVNPEEIAEGARPVLRDGMAARDLIALATKAGVTKVKLAAAIGCEVAAIVDRLGGMTDVERGVLADELNLDWRTA